MINNNNNNFYKPLSHPLIQNGYMLSCNGYIKSSLDDSIKPYYPSYQSSNGYDYESFTLKDGTLQLFPIDDLLALTFIPIPNELQNKRIKVNHIDGNNRNNHIDNLEWIEDIEEWKTVTYPGVKEYMYEISNWGRVKKKGMISQATVPNSRGYIISSFGSGTNKPVSITHHKLTALNFVTGFDGSDMEVNHIDGDKTNNYWKNLEWVSHKNNMNHVYLMGLRNTAKGEDAGLAVIDESLVREICVQLVRFWGSAKSVYDYLKPNNPKVSLRMINHIKNKECWSHISDSYWTKEFIFELGIKKVCKICEKIVEGFSNQEIYDLLIKEIPNLTVRCISGIRTKERWVEISDKYFKNGALRYHKSNL